MNRTKGTILIEGMTSNYGGIETFIYNLYTFLKNDYQVDFLVTDKNIPFENEFLKNGSHIYRVTQRFDNPKKNKKDIEKIFKRGHYDVFWFNKTTLSNVVSLKMAKKYGVSKVICHSHASKNTGNKITFFMHKINRMHINKYVTIKAACSRTAARYFFGKNISDVILFKNAVDIEKYKPDHEKRLDMRNKLGIKDCEVVVTLVAHFVKVKNHEFLIQIANELNKICDCKVLLCGEGELQNDIKQRVRALHLEDKVIFLGRRNDVECIMQATDVFVMPSLHEGLPFVLVEAQAAGLPCLVSDTVSSECAITNLVYFQSLEAPPIKWAEKILSIKKDEKVCPSKELERKGFTSVSLKHQILRTVK